MKRTAIAFAASLFFACAASSASAITIPEGMPGLTQKQFTELENSTCYNGYHDYNYATPEVEMICEPLINQFLETPFFVVETGSMYIIRGDDSVLSLRRYLPDGLYTSGKDERYLHYVQDGILLTLWKNQTYKRLKQAGRLGFLDQLDANQVTGLRAQCGSPSAACDKALQELHLHAGQIFYSSDTKRLYILQDTENGTTFRRLNKRNNNGRIRKRLRQQADPIENSILYQMTSYYIDEFTIGEDYYLGY